MTPNGSNYEWVMLATPFDCQVTIGLSHFLSRHPFPALLDVQSTVFTVKVLLPPPTLFIYLFLPKTTVQIKVTCELLRVKQMEHH